MTHESKEDVLDEGPTAITEDITPRDLMIFAKSILMVATVLFVMGGASELIKPNCGIFEACKTILPPIVTLVIGFYFVSISFCNISVFDNILFTFVEIVVALRLF